MKRKLLIVLCSLLAFGCKKNEEITSEVSSATQTTSVSPKNLNLADGTYDWTINADEIGSSVTDFENAENSLKFSLTRAVEIEEEKKWTWSEIIMVTDENTDWSGFSGIEISYKADKNLSVLLTDSALYKYDPAAVFFAVLPISENDTTIMLTEKDFHQHDWVFEQFPDIRRTIDNSKLFGIKIGTKAMGETTNALISKFVLNGVITK